MRSRRDSWTGLTRPSYTHAIGVDENHHSRSRTRQHQAHVSSASQSREDLHGVTDRTPLLSSSHQNGGATGHTTGFMTDTLPASSRRRDSAGTSKSSHKRRPQPAHNPLSNFDVNNPPSVPGSPQLGADGYGDPMLPASFSSRSPKERRANAPAPDELLIDIDQPALPHDRSAPSSRERSPEQHRRRTLAPVAAEEDVCYPGEDMSAIAEEEDYDGRGRGAIMQSGRRRKRYRHWPDYSVLNEWFYEEKEQRSEGIRTKKISEPVLVGGRLRPQKHGWHRAEEDAPYRFTYFNEELESTIHSQTISELLQQGQDFQDLFTPPQPELSDDESEDDEETSQARESPRNPRSILSPGGQSKVGTRQSSIMGDSEIRSRNESGETTPVPTGDPQLNGSASKEKVKRHGPRPTFWLDVLSPTDQEMRVLSKAFGIHALTAEDIMTQEAREKVELFRNYYFVSYRTFEQDATSEDYLEEVNMYIVVFREGIISFHFSMCPHPANVRRRIRQLKDYIIVSSDWISYALIDDITDAYAPHIQSIEADVDSIDDEILELLTVSPVSPQEKRPEKPGEKGAAGNPSESGADENKSSGGDMLRRIGEVRKKVMKFYRLIGNKADVVKGFAKRCNEYWEVAPRSEIGLYLGDIQDHVLTMTSSLSHYETLLSRAHSNYLAQINIKMNERQEQTADVLGKLTVLGTIVLPMNIITGMWGMNVLVPGQSVDNLNWFWSSKSIFNSPFSRVHLPHKMILLTIPNSYCRSIRVWYCMLFHR